MVPVELLLLQRLRRGAHLSVFHISFLAHYANVRGHWTQATRSPLPRVLVRSRIKI